MENDFVQLSASAHAIPDTVSSVVDAIAKASPHLATLLTPRGGIRSDPLREALEPVLSPFGVRHGGQASFAGNEIHFTGADQRIGVSLQTGRALINNGALISVLASASSPDIDWVIVVVPEIYKSGRVYPKVLDQLRELQSARGIHLDLQGVILVRY